MSGKATISGLEFEWHECVVCGVIVTVPAVIIAKHRQQGGYYYCSNGHRQGWDTAESEDSKIRRERDRLKQQLAQKDDAIAEQKNLREAAERQATAARGQITRLKNRANAGLCPCCNRHFTNLERHMVSKHKDDNVVPLKVATP